MPYEFYKSLRREQREKYDLMLETNYVLLRCDEWKFLETDENDRTVMSASWIQSLQPTLDLFGLDPGYYPQGSISADRHYYEALRNYLGGSFPITEEFNYLRQGLGNFLALRRDDSSTNRSYLFGSYYRVRKTLGIRDIQKYRSVEVSMRHSATALWILLEESKGALSGLLQKSLIVFLNRTENYLERNEDWHKDSYKHLTLGSTIKTCDSLIEKFPISSFTKTAEDIRAGCKNALFSDACLIQNLSGDYAWALPDMNKNKMAKYEYYLDAFVLAQLPMLLKNAKVQSILSGMIANRVRSEVGFGIPIHKLTNFSKYEDAIPDFGATSSVLYLLWYCLENQIGDENWLKYCQDNFNWLLDFCLNAYDKKQYYVLPHSENNTKILLMPQFNKDKLRFSETAQYIRALKEAINIEMEQHNGKLYKLLNQVPAPAGLESTKSIFETWQITKYWDKQKHWTFDASGIRSKFGEMLGGFAVGALRALGS
jgi:hypothetical protein